MTSEIMSCVYNGNTHKWDVEFNSGKTYSYGYSNVEKLTDPVVLNLMHFRLAEKGINFFILNLYMYLNLHMIHIGIFVLLMVEKKIIQRVI